MHAAKFPPRSSSGEGCLYRLGQGASTPTSNGTGPYSPTKMPDKSMFISSGKHCRDLYVFVLIFHPLYLLPYYYPFALNSFLVAKTGLGLYWTMLSVSGLLSLHC